MHTKHEGFESGPITMVCTSGLFIIGELIGGNKLCKPRIFILIEDGRKMQMSTLPGNPTFLTLGADGFRYPLPETDKNIRELYIRVTTPPPESITIDVAGKVVPLNG